MGDSDRGIPLLAVKVLWYVEGPASVREGPPQQLPIVAAARASVERASVLLVA